MVSIWLGPELFLLAPEEARNKGRHLSHPVDPYMFQARAPKMSFWQIRRNDAVGKAKQLMLERVTGDKAATTNDYIDEYWDDEIGPKVKSLLSANLIRSYTDNL